MPQDMSQASKLDARVRSAQAAWAHIAAERTDVVDEIMATLVPDEPYAYTVVSTSGEPAPAGSIPHQEFVSTRADLRASYEDLHRFSTVGPMLAVSEIRADWYVFLYGISEGRIRAIDQTVLAQTAVLFPTMGKDGITGELMWHRLGDGAPYTAGRGGPLAAETALLELHETLLRAMRRADAAAVAGLFHPNAQIGIRDYVDDTGALAVMHSAEELRRYMERFFARFHVHEISLINRLATDWFVFAELRWIVEDTEQPGQRQTFLTAEHAEVRSDGLFATRIGHGADRKSI